MTLQIIGMPQKYISKISQTLWEPFRQNNYLWHPIIICDNNIIICDKHKPPQANSTSSKNRLPSNYDIRRSDSYKKSWWHTLRIDLCRIICDKPELFVSKIKILSFSNTNPSKICPDNRLILQIIIMHRASILKISHTLCEPFRSLTLIICDIQ